jgi:hypothetical protein
MGVLGILPKNVKAQIVQMTASTVFPVTEAVTKIQKAKR